MYYYFNDAETFIFGPFKSKELVKDTDLIILRIPDKDSKILNLKIENSSVLYKTDYEKIPDNFLMYPILDEYCLYNTDNDTLTIPCEISNYNSDWTPPVKFVEETDKPKCLFGLDDVIGLHLDMDSQNLEESLYGSNMLSIYYKNNEVFTIVQDSKLEKIKDGANFGEEGVILMDSTFLDSKKIASNLEEISKIARAAD